ncbi:hypothetical protein LguiA_032443 [Lonicera macranthoides]
MVILGKGRGEEAEKKKKKKVMAMGPPQRSKPLHNFEIPSWGNQKLLRCMKVNSNGEVSAVDRRSPASQLARVPIGRSRETPEFHKHRGSSDRRESLKRSPSPAPFVGGSGQKSKLGEGIEAVRTKLMFDLQNEAVKMKDAIFREGFEEVPPPATDEARPWNLRTRRAACKEPKENSNGGGGKSCQFDLLKPNFSPLRTENKSPRLRGSGIGGTSYQSGEKRERAKFSIALSRQEIEEDFTEMTGHRLPRRPKKRPKNVQKELDMLFPGLWLTEINADFYKVPDGPETAKR